MPKPPPVRLSDVFRSRRMALLFLLGFSSGLPLYLTGVTLTAWMSTAKVDLSQIAIFSFVTLPYPFKFLWAPLLDRYRPPVLGRRRGWLLLSQLGLALAIAAMAAADPRHAPLVLAVLAVLVAFLSASQDIVLGAYQADLLAPEERAAGSGIGVMGYRVAMFVTGTVAFLLADALSWRVAYLSMAALMIVGVVATLLAEEPPAGASGPPTLLDAVRQPFRHFLRRFGARPLAIIVLFTIAYRFGDYVIERYKIELYKNVLGFTLTEIATVNKAFVIAAVALGAVAVGVLAPRLGVRRALLWFGVLQATTNLLYVLLAQAGKSYPVLGLTIFCDNFAGTLGSVTFVAYLLSLCDREVSATQYAILTALSSVGGHFFGWLGAPLVDRMGWSGFFVATALMALPGLLLASLVPIPAAEEPVSREAARTARL